MSNFISLLKVRLLSFMGMNKILHAPKEKKLSGVAGFLIVSVLLTGGIGAYSYVYADAMAQVYALAGVLDRLIPTMLGTSAVICLLFSFYTASNVLYGFKDYDMLSAMPVKTSTVVLSKIVFSYIGDLALTLIVAIGSVIAFAKYAIITFSYVALMALAVILVPLLPIAVSLFIGALTSYLSSRFKRKNLVQIILTLTLLFGILAFTIISSIQNGGMISVEQLYLPMPWLIKFFYEWKYALLFSGVSLISVLLITMAVILTYKKMNTLILSRITNSNYKIKSEYKKKNLFGVLYFKEVKRLFSCSVYAMNNLTGSVMALIGAIVMAILINSVDLGISFGSELVVFFVAFISFTAMTAPTTNCSISIEGQSFWVIKTAPVPMRMLFNAKILLNVTFNTVFVALASLLFTVITKFGIEFVILSVYTSAVISLLGGNLGLIFNVLFPVFKWEHPNKVVKESLSIFITMVSSLLYAGLIVGATFLIKIPAIYLLLAVAILSTVLTILTYLFIMLKCEKILDKKI